MKAFQSLTFHLSLSLFCLTSCHSGSSNSNENLTFSIEIKDSVTVDFLGDYKLQDFDPISEKYLLRDNQSNATYLEVNISGEILDEMALSTDGKDAVGNIVGMGYFKGDVTVMSTVGSFFMFRDSVKIDELPLLQPFSPWMGFEKLGLFEIDGYAFYPNPLSENVMKQIGNMGNFFRALYKMPVLQRQDLNTKDTLGVMSLPSKSTLLDGKIHGMIFPVYSVSDKHVIYTPGVGNEFYIFQKEAGQLNFFNALTIKDPEFVMNEPVATDDPADYFNRNDKFSPGEIRDVLVLDEYYLAVYQKGVSELKMPTKIEGKEQEYFLQIDEMNPFYASVYDRELNLLASGIPFPKNIQIPRIVNSKNEIVVVKDPNLSETEDDGIVLYVLNFKTN